MNSNIGLNDIKTLEQLLKSNLIIKIPNTLETLFTDDENSVAPTELHSLMNQALRVQNNRSNVTLLNEDDLFAAFKNRDAAILLPENYARHYVSTIFDNSTGEDCLSLVEEGPYVYYVSNMVPKKSPFKKRFNEITTWTVEAGIIRYQISQAIYDDAMTYLDRAKMGKVPIKKFRNVTFNQLIKLFYLYLVLNGIAFVVFLVENICRQK